MGGYNIPSFILSPAALQLEQDPRTPYIEELFDQPMDMLYLHPFVDKDPWYWPPVGQLIFDFSDPSTGMSMMLNPSTWSLRAYENTDGGSLPYMIKGVAKDYLGNPKAGCRASLYMSVGDIWVSDDITDPNGIYAFEVPNNSTLYYVRCFQDSPQMAGITARTLTGA